MLSYKVLVSLKILRGISPNLALDWLGMTEPLSAGARTHSTPVGHNPTAQSLEEASLRDQVRLLSDQLMQEKKRADRLESLLAFGLKLESLADAPLAAQLAAVTLHANLRCSLACIFANSPLEQRLILLASAGPASSSLPPNYRHSLTRGLVGRAVRSQKALIDPDSKEDTAPLQAGEYTFRSQMAVPMIVNGYLEGLILLADTTTAFFTPYDLSFAEMLRGRLQAAWTHLNDQQSLAELVKSSAQLTNRSDPQELLMRIAEIARRTVKAQFVMAVLTDKNGLQSAASGKAPLLQETLTNGSSPFLAEALTIPNTFRTHDLRKDPRSNSLVLDRPDLRSLLFSRIMFNGKPTGLILAFGRKAGIGFSEQDAFLLDLLTAHAAVTLERSILDRELRSALRTTQLLYDLTLRISETDDLNSAAQVIARAAYRLFQASACGLVLLSPEGRTEAAVHLPTDVPGVHPEALIRKAMDTRQVTVQPRTEGGSRTAIPIQTARRCYGALWLEIEEDAQPVQHPLDDMRILTNQAAIALERSILLTETRQQATRLSHTVDRLERTNYQILYALTKALDARDKETENHSNHVVRIAMAIGRQMGLSPVDLKALEHGAILHDIGKLGIRDSILTKTDRLNETEWAEMREHPAKGEKIIRDIPILQDALPVIANHHERWDGSGYPRGLSGDEIPLLARIFAVADVYEALTSTRRYRNWRMDKNQALQYIESKSGVLFDPRVVAVVREALNNYRID